MITPIRTTVLAATALAALALVGCSAPAGTAPSETSATESSAAEAPSTSSGSAAGDDCAGVSVYVKTGALELDEDITVETCVATDEPILAADALAEAGVETEGTTQYGDQVVCRVNGVPQEDLTLTAADGTEYNESCETMPAAFAYWSIWEKPAGGEWGYAQEGLSTLELEPGDSLELLFALNDATAAPTE